MSYFNSIVSVRYGLAPMLVSTGASSPLSCQITSPDLRSRIVFSPVCESLRSYLQSSRNTITWSVGRVYRSRGTPGAYVTVVTFTRLFSNFTSDGNAANPKPNTANRVSADDNAAVSTMVFFILLNILLPH